MRCHQLTHSLQFHLCLSQKEKPVNISPWFHYNEMLTYLQEEKIANEKVDEILMPVLMVVIFIIDLSNVNYPILLIYMKQTN